MSTPAVRLGLLSVFAFCLAMTCRADVIYTFSYTASSGPIQDFSFSFTTPNYVTVGSSPEFNPFTLTDGVNSQTLTTDKVDQDPGGHACFLFGTSSTVFGGLLPFPPPFNTHVNCGGGALLFSMNGDLPSAPGIYVAGSFGGVFFTPPPCLACTGGTFEFLGDNTGTMSLSVSGTPSVPEPSTWLLFAAPLAGSFYARHRIRPRLKITRIARRGRCAVRSNLD